MDKLGLWNLVHFLLHEQLHSQAIIAWQTVSIESYTLDNQCPVIRLNNWETD